MPRNIPKTADGALHCIVTIGAPGKAAERRENQAWGGNGRKPHDGKGVIRSLYVAVGEAYNGQKPHILSDGCFKSVIPSLSICVQDRR